MNNEINYSCDNCLFYSNTGCKSNILCIRGSNYFPSDAPNISYQEVKIKKIEKSDEIKRLRTARNILHRLEDRGILENNLSMEQITAIRTAEYALDELCKSKDAQPVKRGKWEYIRNVKLSGTIKLCECNQCHNKIFGDLNYCGNCGAKMDGEQND